MEIEWSLLVLVLLTGINTIFMVAECFLTHSKMYYYWFGIREGAVLLFFMEGPLKKVILKGVHHHRFHLFSKYSWSGATLVAIEEIIRVVIFSALAFSIHLLPQSSKYQNEDDLVQVMRNPWSFAAKYFCIISAFYYLLQATATWICAVALHEYSRVRVFHNLQPCLIDSGSLLILDYALRSPADPKTFREIEKIVEWVTVESLIARRRLMEVESRLERVDLNSLSDGLYSRYRQQQSLQHSLVYWNEFLYQFLHSLGRSNLSKCSLINLREISKTSVQEAMETIKSKCNILSRELQNHNKLFRQLERCFNVVVLMILLFVILPMLGFNPNVWLLPLGVSLTPTLLSFTVIFGPSITATIEAIIFTLYRHPFDAGDEVRINGVYYEVKQVGIMVCILENMNGIKVYMPVTALIQSNIVNMTMAKKSKYQIVLSFGCQTPIEQIKRISRLLMIRITECIPTAVLKVEIIEVGKEYCHLILQSDQSGSINGLVKSRLIQEAWRVLQDEGVENLADPLIKIIQL